MPAEDVPPADQFAREMLQMHREDPELGPLWDIAVVRYAILRTQGDLLAATNQLLFAQDDHIAQLGRDDEEERLLAAQDVYDGYMANMRDHFVHLTSL